MNEHEQTVQAVEEEFVFLMHADAGFADVLRTRLHEAGIESRTQSYSADAFSATFGGGFMGAQIFVPASNLEAARTLLNVLPDANGAQEQNATKSNFSKRPRHVVSALLVIFAFVVLLLFMF